MKNITFNQLKKYIKESFYNDDTEPLFLAKLIYYEDGYGPNEINDAINKESEIKRFFLDIGLVDEKDVDKLWIELSIYKTNLNYIIDELSYLKRNIIVKNTVDGIKLHIPGDNDYMTIDIELQYYWQKGK